MGVTNYALEQLIRLLKSRDERTNHGALLTLSRYKVPSYKDLLSIASHVGYQVHIDRKYLSDKYASDEIVFKALGFQSVDSMDYSGYEGANIIYDLNSLSPSTLPDQYDYIIDAGTMEHVFNLPNVLKNIFSALKSGGTFIFDFPFWYEPSHGFYNFSHKLFYDYFTVNKWKIEKMSPYAIDGTSFIELPFGTNFATPHGLCWGAVTKTPETTCDLVPYDGLYNDVWQKQQQVLNNIAGLLEKVTCRLFLYGAGEVAQRLLNIIRSIDEAAIHGVISATSSEIGRTFMYGLPISDEGVLQSDDTVIIASELYQDEIFERIHHLTEKGVRIIKLYD